jgi:hypothetical protein
MRRPAARLALALALALSASAASAGDATPAAAGQAGTRAHASFAAYRRFLAAGGGVEDPSLFTAASRVHLARAPRAAGAEAARLAELDAAAPLRLVVVGDRAALIPRRTKARSTRPVLLERVAGTWRVDLVEAEKSFEPDAAGGLRFRYDGSPYLAVLGLSYPRSVVEGELEPVDLFGEDPASAIARLEGVRSPASRLRLAEILLRNCWLVDAALPLYEEAARSAEDPWPFARILGYRALVVGQPDRAIPLLEPLEPRSDRLLGLLHRRAGRLDVWQHYERRSLLEHLEHKGILERVPSPEAGPGFRRL